MVSNTPFINAHSGLTEGEAKRRLAQFGPNELPASRPRTLVRIVIDALQEPLLLLLIAASSIYLALGDTGEGGILMVLAVADLGIVVYQDRKTERVLEALRDLASPHAMVFRDGTFRRSPARELVPGDVIMAQEGERIAADAWVLNAMDAAADESLLTGESAPVRKVSADDRSFPPPRPGGMDVPYLFAGSVLVRGQCLAEVGGTGADTEIGRIGKSLAHIEFEETRIRRSAKTLAFWMAIFGAAVSLAVVGLQLWRTGELLTSLLAGLTIAMSMLPEELPIVFTVFLTLGAWRISARRVLTRRIDAIETLGAATILCTDKTGTLTVNKMKVTHLASDRGQYVFAPDAARPDWAKHLLDIAALASQAQAADPMERAFRDAAPEGAPGTIPPPLRVYGLRPELLAVAHVRAAANGEYDVAAKGAPEAIASLCGLSDAERSRILEDTARLAKGGLRVLAVAAARHSGPLPETPRGFAFSYLGLAGLSDPVRASVPGAVMECKSAGIRVIVLTGDFPETALAIAKEAGIDGERAVTGRELEDFSDAELREALTKTSVFARIMPEQKHRIVRVLKEMGEIVAMTGDGVNDAPALKAAHIGIAMGGKGTDVAREAAALVLLDDAFESIVAAIRLGRRIYNNLRKAISYILAVHVPIAGVALAPLLFGWPIVFSPVHIVFLELVIDPVCSIAFEAEPEEKNIMRRPPRDPRRSLFSERDVVFSLCHGAFGLFAILTVYGWSLATGMSDLEARAIAFTAIVTVNFSMILNIRAQREPLIDTFLRPNPILWSIFGITLVLLMTALYVGPVAALFRFAAPAAMHLMLALLPACAVLLTGGLTRPATAAAAPSR